jgi:hypothetical protein
LYLFVQQLDCLRVNGVAPLGAIECDTLDAVFKRDQQLITHGHCLYLSQLINEIEGGVIL